MLMENTLSPSEMQLREDFKLRIKELYTNPTTPKVMKELGLLAAEMEKAENTIRYSTSLYATGVYQEMIIEYQSPNDASDEFSYITAAGIREGLSKMQDRIDGKPLPGIEKGSDGSSKWMVNHTDSDRGVISDCFTCIYFLAEAALGKDEVEDHWIHYEEFKDQQIDTWFKDEDRNSMINAF